MRKLKIGIAALFVAFVSSLSAQNVPVDKSIRIGTLKNGMKYYIKKNQKPEKKVELRLVINAGSILEDEDQRGLAHFMEHMNFNGTTHFPDNKLVDFLQSIGIKFGQHLNAYTSFDETVYMLPVPLDKPENLASGLQVIEDWAFNATLDGKQIDKERGVVLEELRLGLGPDKRMMDRYLPKVMYKSQYAKRLPIGDKKLLETFSYDKIRRFHKEWYRPNLMAVVVVGDIDVNDIEKRIKKIFSKYKNPKNARPRKIFDTPVHKETLVAVESDPDASFARVQLLYKDTKPAEKIETVAQYNKDLITQVYSVMMSNRIQELVDSDNPPFTYGSVSYSGTWARNQKGLQGFAMTKPGEQLQGLEVLINEIERAKRFGFTKNELKRAKDEITSRLEQSKNNKNKTQSRVYVDEYKRNFLAGEPIPGIDWEYAQFKKFAPEITLDKVNKVAQNLVTKENRVVVITGPEKADIKQPTEKEVLALFNDAKFSKLKPYEEKAMITKLIKKLPKKGKIVKTKTDKKLGTTTFTLSNGVQVTYKKTNFKDDQILFRAVSKGGKSVLDDKKVLNTTFAFAALSDAGFNGYTKSEIDRYLSGKQVRVSPYIGDIQEGMSGSSSVKDFKVLMEMVYSYFTGLNFNQASFDAYKKKMSALYGTLTSNPQFYFGNELNKFMNKKNPRTTNLIPLTEDWARTNYKEAYDVYKAKFADADDFHFYFVGNIDEAKLKKYAEQYIASLPKTKSTENFKDNGYRSIKGSHNKVFKKGKDPKSMVVIAFGGETKYNEKEALALQALAGVTTIKVIEQLREDESGIYGGGANGHISKEPYGEFDFTIQFPCGPENAEKLTKSALNELDKLLKNGIDKKDLDKFKKGEINDLNTQLKTNKFWLRNLANYSIKGGDKYEILNIEKKINALTTKDLQAVGKKYLTGDKIIATLMPEDGWEKNVKKEDVKSSAIPPQQILDGYIKALGGKKKIASIKTVSFDNTMKMMGMSIEGHSKMMVPNKFRRSQKIMGSEMLQVFDGEKGYMMQGGQKIEMNPEMVAQSKKERIFEGIGLKGEDFTSVELAVVDKENFFLLKQKDGTEYYFDTQTNLLKKIKKAGSETQITKYIQKDGIKFPSKMSASANGQSVEIEISNLVFNKGVTEADFK
ncbi:MAG: peptidase M16 [Bacteroidia bacterium]|nr:MAG: peptidase M16 [Bacteroidia bacterium]